MAKKPKQLFKVPSRAAEYERRRRDAEANAAHMNAAREPMRLRGIAEELADYAELGLPVPAEFLSQAA